MVVRFAGGVACLIFDSAFICPVIAAAGSAGVGIGCTCACKMAPFHALHWFMLESAWEDPKAADPNSVSDADVSYLGVFSK